MPNWTVEQQQAISARNHTILVSAAAGSGKTAVLIERIVTLIKEGCRLDRMMIVTFTRAAAAEMRQRLQERLVDEARLDPIRMGAALDQLEQAEISTIHRFCQRVLREDFQAVGIDPLTKICEEQQRVHLFELAWQTAMNELLEADTSPDFTFLADQVDQKDVFVWIQRLYAFLMSMPHPFDWVRAKIDDVTAAPYDQQPWYQPMRDWAIQQLDGIDELLAYQRTLFDQPEALTGHMVNWQADCATHASFKEQLQQNPAQLSALIATYTLPRLKSVKIPGGKSPAEEEWEKNYKKQREQHKALVKDIAEAVRIDEAVLGHDLAVVQRLLRGLVTLCERVHSHFLALKREQNCMDFQDLEQLTLSIMEQPAQRERIQSSFDHIFVDECQDVSAIQDAILQAVHGADSCLFMVGDVKQSIYRFRLADPTLFLHRMRTFSRDDDAPERAIFLQRNFRSAPAVLDATNRVFRRTMRRRVTELDYLPEDELLPGRDVGDTPPVTVALLQADEDLSTAKWLEAQAAQAAEIIRQLLRQQFEMKGTLRPYTYRDIVILMPAVRSHGAALAKLLESHGIPVYFDGSDDYFALPEILAVRSLLDVIANPLQDVPLLATLKMTPFLLSDGDLCDIRLCKTGRDVPFHEAFEACCEGETALSARCRTVRDQLAGWRFLSNTRPLADFLWQLLRETGLYAASGALPEGELRQANMLLMCQKAAEYEAQGGVTLHGFLDALEHIRAAGDATSAKILGEEENLVRIMTIHKSKGLEFPAVLVLGLDDPLHRAHTKGVQTSARLGVSVPYYNRSVNVSRETMLDRALRLQQRLDEKAERARLLYVAMTRARDRLYLLGRLPAKIPGVWRLKDSDYRTCAAGCMLDWVMQAVLDDNPQLPNRNSTTYPQPENPWLITVSGVFDDEHVEKGRNLGALWKNIEEILAAPQEAALDDAWRDIYTPQAQQPLKTSVTAMVRMMDQPEAPADEEETAADKAIPFEQVTHLRLPDAPLLPAFMQAEGQPTGAERGTIIHHALALLPLEPLRTADSMAAAVADGVRYMLDHQLITPAEHAQIRPNMLLNYFQSDLGRRMLASPRIRREWSFTLPLSAGAETMMQGVIDCAFEESGAWVLVDYKTDRITDEAAFVERYRRQLDLYAHALETITGQPVKEKYLYSLSFAKAIPV